MLEGNNRIGGKSPFDTIATGNFERLNTNDFEEEPLGGDEEEMGESRSRGIASVGKFKEDLILLIKSTQNITV